MKIYRKEEILIVFVEWLKNDVITGLLIGLSVHRPKVFCIQLNFLSDYWRFKYNLSQERRYFYSNVKDQFMALFWRPYILFFW